MTIIQLKFIAAVISVICGLLFLAYRIRQLLSVKNKPLPDEILEQKLREILKSARGTKKTKSLRTIKRRMRGIPHDELRRALNLIAEPGEDSNGRENWTLSA